MDKRVSLSVSNPTSLSLHLSSLRLSVLCLVMTRGRLVASPLQPFTDDQKQVVKGAEPTITRLAEKMLSFNPDGKGAPSKSNANAVLMTMIEDSQMESFMNDAFTLAGALMMMSTNSESFRIHH